MNFSDNSNLAFNLDNLNYTGEGRSCTFTQQLYQNFTDTKNNVNDNDIHIENDKMTTDNKRKTII